MPKKILYTEDGVTSKFSEEDLGTAAFKNTGQNTGQIPVAPMGMGVMPQAKAILDPIKDLTDSAAFHEASEFATVESLTQKADLIEGFIPSSQIRSQPLYEYLGVFANQAEMLAITISPDEDSVKPGDFGIRGDTGDYAQLTALPASVLGNWRLSELPSPLVFDVNGQIGHIQIGKADIGLPLTPNLAAVDFPVSTAQANADRVIQEAAEDYTDSIIANLTSGEAMGGIIENAPAITLLADADSIGVAQGSILKHITWTSIKSILKTYFDTLYTTTLAVTTQLASYVPKTRTINGKALTSDIVINKNDLNLGDSENTSDADKPLSNATISSLSTLQSYAIQRNNHTGTQAVNTITGLGSLATQNGTFSGISSGTNSGDETQASIKSKLGVGTSIVDGYLSKEDWIAFNAKQATLGFTPANITALALKADITALNLKADTSYVDSAILNINEISRVPSQDIVLSSGFSSVLASDLEILSGNSYEIEHNGVLEIL